MQERSILQSIREKELEANIGLDATRGEAAQLIEAARREAEATLKEAEREATVSVEEYTLQERERTSREIEDLKRRELARLEEAGAAGERHLAEAVERIVNTVVPG